MTEPETPIDPFDSPADSNVQGSEHDYLEGQSMLGGTLPFNLANPNVRRKFDENHKKIVDSLPDFDSLPPVQ